MRVAQHLLLKVAYITHKFKKKNKLPERLPPPNCGASVCSSLLTAFALVETQGTPIPIPILLLVTQYFTSLPQWIQVLKSYQIYQPFFRINKPNVDDIRLSPCLQSC